MRIDRSALVLAFCCIVAFAVTHAQIAIPGAGIIGPVAGNGNACANPAAATGPCGDGGVATSAQVSSPSGVAVDSSGNVYIADTGDFRIRKVSATSGDISTVAGNGNACSNPTAATGACGDGGAATSAQLNNPSGVAVDQFGNIYIADTGDNRIRVVNLRASGQAETIAGVTIQPGDIATVAGNGTAGFKDDTTATGGELNGPTGVAVDSSGNIYIADKSNQRLRLVTTSGAISTLAGVGSGLATTWVLATAAQP
jgi:trimeric autotransporter adhesin